MKMTSYMFVFVITFKCVYVLTNNWWNNCLARALSIYIGYKFILLLFFYFKYFYKFRPYTHAIEDEDRREN